MFALLLLPILSAYCLPQGYNYPGALTSYGTPFDPYNPSNPTNNQIETPGNNIPPTGNYNPTGNFNGYGPPSNNFGSYQPSNVPENQGNGSVIVHKHIYVHVPPPEEEEERRPNGPVTQLPPQKHYKIIFIKAPSQEIKRQNLVASQPQNEEKTIVYVLVKKPEDVSGIQIPTIPPTAPSKPEVYFIKYKTQKSGSTGAGAFGYPNSPNGATGEISITTVASVAGNEASRGINIPGGIQGGSISDALLNAGTGSITGTQPPTTPSYTTYTTPGITGPY